MTACMANIDKTKMSQTLHKAATGNEPRLSCELQGVSMSCTGLRGGKVGGEEEACSFHAWIIFLTTVPCVHQAAQCVTVITYREALVSLITVRFTNGIVQCFIFPAFLLSFSALKVTLHRLCADELPSRKCELSEDSTIQLWVDGMRLERTEAVQLVHWRSALSSVDPAAYRLTLSKVAEVKTRKRKRRAAHLQTRWLWDILVRPSATNKVYRNTFCKPA